MEVEAQVLTALQRKVRRVIDAGAHAELRERWTLSPLEDQLRKRAVFALLAIDGKLRPSAWKRGHVDPPPHRNFVSSARPATGDSRGRSGLEATVRPLTSLNPDAES